ncbi:MAG TPA: alpha/beta hydrolase [Tepidiformaceae bacterium]|nr:alpha/beta hydrolase [Tepidiformaceae bacterium]
MPTVVNQGWTIHYEEQGERGRPALLMTLGLSHRLAHWGTLVSRLADVAHVITWDCRGMGESERRDEAYTIEDEVADMAAVLDAVGLRSAAVYGRSRGGMLAQAFALAHPERVSALILSGTSHHGPGSIGSTEAVNRAMEIRPDMSREQIFATQNEAMAAPGWRERDPEAFNYLMSVDLEAPPRRFAVARQQEAVASWSSFARLGDVRGPTFVIWGADDGMVPPKNSRQIAAKIARARLELIPQCGHLPMLEKPGEVTELVVEFLGLGGR